MKRLVIIILGIFGVPFLFYAQTQNFRQLQKKVALIIGNGNYIGSTLANPENDARSMKDVLQNLGFIVTEFENLNQGRMKKAIDDFGFNLKDADVGLFYYAGHGIQSNGYNYLVPIDVQLSSEKQVEYDCVQADRVLAIMEGASPLVNIIILDACRNNPFERSWTRSTTGKGLAFMNAPKGTLIAYATSPGSTASDGSGNNGLYTSAILESIVIPDITIIQVFQNVRSIVTKKSNEQQIPWESTSLTGDFYFNSQKNKIVPSLENLPVQETAPKDSNFVGNFFIDPRDGEGYKVIKIGDQTWMAENLRATKFNDNTNISLITDYKIWDTLSAPAYCWYGNSTYYKDPYGGLYNGYAITTNKLCPIGWHIPSMIEWKILIDYCGGLEFAGIKLKEQGKRHWIDDFNATNLTGFTALPGGVRYALKKKVDFTGIGSEGVWWSSTLESDKYNSYRGLNISFTSNVFLHSLIFKCGYSVRCIMDK